MELADIMTQKRNEGAREAAKKYGSKLWHYTNFNALDGILSNKEIWLSSTASMNDKDELKGFINELKQEVLADTGRENHLKVEDVFKKINARLSEEYPYIFCVSRAKNDAAQWERYAQGGRGVAIVFNTEELFKLIFHNRFLMSEEYYGYHAKTHKLKNILVEYVKNNETDGFKDLDGVIENLLLCAMIHKHESFASEQEIRISPYFVKDEDKHLEYKVMGTVRRIYNMNLTELCEKEKIDLQKLISAIVIGPKSEQNVADLKWYLHKIDLPELVNKVEKSDCPLR